MPGSWFDIVGLPAAGAFRELIKGCKQTFESNPIKEGGGPP